MRLAVPLVMLLIWLTFFFVLAQRAFAEELGPAYTLDHPIDPNLLLLATAEGRTPIARMTPDCGWLVGDMNVTVDGVQARTGHLVSVIAHLSSGDRGCTVAVGDVVDPTPCFANEDGVCDVNAGEHYW